MATPRLPFLWPFLFSPSSSSQITRTATRQVSRRHLQTATTRRQGTTTQRYGTANEPFLSSNSEPVTGEEQREGTVIDVKALSRRPKKDRTRKTEGHATGAAAFNAQNRPVEDDSHADTVGQTPTKSDGKIDPVAEAAPSVLTLARTESKPNENDTSRTAVPDFGNTNANANANGPSTKQSDSLLDSPPSASLEMATVPAQNPNGVRGENRPPHMNTPPYEHHFNTWGLVKSLEVGGWSRDQSITIMKAVRQILLENMTLATAALVSKSNVENETYLFRAACSELKTEISTKRKAETEKSRTQRTHLQHEVDILSQKLDQQGMWLKDELRGMFDDRKMAVRNEQRSMQSKIQELNYRITVALNSDSRSDVEGVRWIITKRAIAAIVICVVMVLSSLKYSSVVAQAEEEARKRHAEAQREMGGSRLDRGPSATANGGRGPGSERRGADGGDDPSRREDGRGPARGRTEGGTEGICG